MSKKSFLKGTFILTFTGFISRFMGFFYRIFLSHTIGAEGVGLYQLMLPLQAFLLALSTSGIQTSISRICAEKSALKKSKDAIDYFFSGTFLSVSLSLLASFLLYANADFFAAEILNEPRTYLLIRLLAFNLPLNALHTCINSFYFSQKKTGIPAGLQLFEQIVRVSSSYLIYFILTSRNEEPTPIIAAGGALISEIAVSIAAFFCLSMNLHQKKYSIYRLSRPFEKIKEIFYSSLPLTLNRLLMTLLTSIEVLLIPKQLQMSGLSNTDALSIYGIFTGMALPIIFFPSAITNSASVMLMPSISQLHVQGHQKRIRYVITRISMICISLGSACTIIFFIFGKIFGRILFNSPTAGIYIQTLSFICPFLYLNTTLISILHGLGKNTTCLLHNLAGALLRIAFVILAIPLLGIRGYLYGILLNETLSCLLHTIAIYRYTHPKIP